MFLKIILIVLIVIIISYIIISNGKERFAGYFEKDIKYGGAVSKLETYVGEIFTKITGKKFEQAHPKWLIYKGKHLELDGYNEELGLAFEVQGPQHTRFDYKYDKDYSEYYNRLLNDHAKRKLCLENGVHLIVIDYTVTKHHVANYIKSRLYDLCNKTIANITNGKTKENQNKFIKFICGNNNISMKPHVYSIEKPYEPYRNKIYETELKLTGVDELKIDIEKLIK